MKKRVLVSAAAVLLLGGSIGFAAGTSLIGSKVTGVFSIEKEGVKIADAAIINGSAYVPVRKMAEATGTELVVEGKKIIMQTQDTAVLDYKLKSLNDSLTVAVERVAALNVKLKEAEDFLLTRSDQKEIDDQKNFIETVLKPRIAEAQAQVVKIETEILTYEAQVK